MKGVIFCCLAELVKEKMGVDKWRTILEKSGMSPSTNFLPTEDIADNVIAQTIQNTCTVLNFSVEQAADAFGDYWVNTYASKIYKVYFNGKNTAKELLLNMDSVHKTVTQSIPNAHPPRFDYKWKNDNTLVITYHSKRGMIDFLLGLIKAVGKHFKETLIVTKIDATQIEVVFP
jgi:hypothetical protein